MDDNSIEIRDNEIDVEKSMEKIRENIRRRQAGEDHPLNMYSLIEPSVQNFHEHESEDPIQRDLAYLQTNWNIHNDRYFIRSHHPYIGKFLVKGRQIVHGEVCRYVDPIISWQTEFNASTVRIISRTSQRCDELNQRQYELEKAFSTLKQEYEKTLSDGLTNEKNEWDTKFELTTIKHAENVERIRHEFNTILEKYTATIRSELNAEIEARVQERELIREERRAAIDQAILSHISDLKNDFTTKLNQKILTDQSELRPFIEKLNGLIHPDELHLNALLEEGRIKVKEKVDARIKEIFFQMDEDIHTRSRIVHVLEERIQKELAQKRALPASPPKGDLNYFLFEERFRGSREDIAQRQMAFLPYFENCSRVLDIGCGRGEFLEILKNNNIGGIGVDSDPDMVTCCHSLQLEVEESDAIAYLETLDDDSLDGIFIDQVVEHLEPDYLIRLLALCYQKIKSGYYIVVESVNPLSFVSFVNFYIDMTHKRPVHPETLQYLFRIVGFQECEKKFFSPVSDESRLRKIETIADMEEKERKNNEIYNNNVEILNTVLFGAQDYAVIGKK